MKKFVVPAVAAALMVSSSLAFASQSAVGTVKEFDGKAMTLTLNDGTVYYLPKNFKDPGLKPGEKVTIAWDMVNKKHEADSVKIVK